MAKKKYYWLKLKEDFFRQKEIKKLRKIAGGDTYTIIYFKMQLLSLKNDAKLFFEGIEDNFIEEIALEIDEDIDNVKVTILFLQKYGFLEEVQEGEYFLPKTSESIGSETDSAERVRRLRAKNKTEELQCNGGVTKCNTEIERRDREKREEIEKREKRIGQMSDICPIDKKNTYDFEKFWNLYPRKIEKQKALKRFKKVCTSIKKYEELLFAATNYANVCANKEAQYIKHCSTWLSNWEDYLEIADTVKKEILINNNKMTQTQLDNIERLKDWREKHA